MLTHEHVLHLHAGFVKVAVRKAPHHDSKVERLIIQGGAAVLALAKRLDDGSLSEASFVEQALASIRDHAHRAAEVGASVHAGKEDLDAIDSYVDDQESYLDGFAGDITGGEMSPAAIAVRAALYGGVMWTAYQMGKTHGAPDDTSWVWSLDPAADHCEDPDGFDCPSFAEGGPYTTDELPAMPGDGTTPCLGKCRCGLDAVAAGDE